jgi:hypothetical protein
LTNASLGFFKAVLGGRLPMVSHFKVELPKTKQQSLLAIMAHVPNRKPLQFIASPYPEAY